MRLQVSKAGKVGSRGARHDRVRVKPSPPPFVFFAARGVSDRLGGMRAFRRVGSGTGMLRFGHRASKIRDPKSASGQISLLMTVSTSIATAADASFQFCCSWFRFRVSGASVISRFSAVPLQYLCVAYRQGASRHSCNGVFGIPGSEVTYILRRVDKSWSLAFKLSDRKHRLLSPFSTPKATHLKSCSL